MHETKPARRAAGARSWVGPATQVRQMITDDATSRGHGRHQQRGDELEICQMDDNRRGDEQHDGCDDDMNNGTHMLLPSASGQQFRDRTVLLALRERLNAPP